MSKPLSDSCGMSPDLPYGGIIHYLALASD
jgi:hypothetical protein